MAVRTFLDTGVLLSAFRGASEISDKAFVYLRDPESYFVASDYSKLELYPKASFEGNKDEVSFYDNFFADVREFVETTPQVVDESLELGKRFGLSAGDAMLAQAAIRLRTERFITTEKGSKPLFRIPSSELTIVSILGEPKRHWFSSLVLRVVAFFRFQRK